MINPQAPHQAPHLDTVGDQGVVQHRQHMGSECLLCLGHQGKLPLLVPPGFLNWNNSVQLPRVMKKHYICEDKNELLHILNERIEYMDAKNE